jgi:RNA polymerase sigma-70 factor (ECF subfamily)
MPSRASPDVHAAATAHELDLLNGLHQRYSPALKAYFAKRAPAHTDPEDLVQDVFVRLAGRGEAEAIRHAERYLFRTAANVLRDHSRRDAVRRSGVHEAFDEDLHGREEISPERVLEDRETVAALLDALEQLPERTRAVFVLHRFDGMRYGDIARQLGVSVSSVEKHMMKALAHVTRCMESLS